MPTLNIGGTRVNVDDSFTKLSPDEQNQVVDEISQSLPGSKRSGTIGEGLDALVRGAANAATFGFADRIAAGMAALTGVGGKRDEYNKNLADQRSIDKANLEQHPYLTMGGNIAGALALPIGAASQAPTLAGRALASAGIGAAQGAAYGAGSSPDLTNIPEVAGNMAAGAGVGGLVGAAAPAVVEGITAAGGALARKTGIPQAVAGLRDPQGTAASIVADAMNRDAASGSAGLSEQQFRQALQRGQPVVTADLGGDATRNLARTAANMSDEAATSLNGVIDPRFETQGPRIADMLTGMGAGNSVKTLDDLKAAAQAANKPLYKKAYEEGANGIWNDDIQKLTAAPAMQEAIKNASKTGANADIAAGFPATKNPFVEAADGTMVLAKNGDGSVAIPSLQFWDHVQRNLRDMADETAAGGKKYSSGTINNIRKSLVDQLDIASPTFAQARGTAAKAFGAEDALEAGKAFVTAKGQNNEYAKAIASMSPPEKALFAHGFASEIQSKLGEIRDRRNVVIDNMFSTPASRQRIEMALGRDNAEKLKTALYAEDVMDKLRVAVQGGSTTARQWKNMAAISGLVGSGTYLGSGDMKDASAAALGAAAMQHGSLKINSNVMRYVGQLLASQNPGAVQKAVAIIGASKPIQETLAPFAAGLRQAVISNDAERRKASYQR